MHCPDLTLTEVFENNTFGAVLGVSEKGWSGEFSVAIQGSWRI
jgi:hypothetical protein